MAAWLLRSCRKFLPNGHDDVSQLDPLDPEPRDARAYRRLRDYFRTWRDRHEATADPLKDETSDQYYRPGRGLMVLAAIRKPRSSILPIWPSPIPVGPSLMDGLLALSGSLSLMACVPEHQ